MSSSSYNMSIEDIISEVERICRKYHVEHLALFGSYAEGTERPTSDIDFILWGGENMSQLQEEIETIPTLKKLDLFQYNDVTNPELKEDMDRYAKEIY